MKQLLLALLVAGCLTGTALAQDYDDDDLFGGGDDASDVDDFGSDLGDESNDFDYSDEDSFDDAIIQDDLDSQ